MDRWFPGAWSQPTIPWPRSSAFRRGYLPRPRRRGRPQPESSMAAAGAPRRRVVRMVPGIILTAEAQELGMGY